MALVIRLRQQGRRNHLTYRLVVADARSPRDGKYVEMLGWYDPHLESSKNFHATEERVEHWLGLGAQLSDKAEALLKRALPGTIRKWKLRGSKRKKKSAK